MISCIPKYKELAVLLQTRIRYLVFYPGKLMRVFDVVRGIRLSLGLVSLSFATSPAQQCIRDGFKARF